MSDVKLAKLPDEVFVFATQDIVHMRPSIEEINSLRESLPKKVPTTPIVCYVRKDKETLEKPICKLRGQVCYDYHEVIEYIEKKYKRETRNWANYRFDNSGIPYQDFWHWVIDQCDEIRNGCFFELCIDPNVYTFTSETEFVKEILDILNKEFPEVNGYMQFWTDW